MKSARFLFSIILFLAAANSASAIGIGLIMKDTGAQQTSQMNFLSSPLVFIFQRLVGTDLTLDTAVAEDLLFNYRLNFDCETSYSDSAFYGSPYNINRFMCTNTFGFGLIRTRFVRLWLGPQLMSSYEFRSHDNYVSDAAVYNKLGAVAGINIHANERITFSVETGLRLPVDINITGSGLNARADNRIEPILGFKVMFRSFDSFLHSGIY